MEDKNMFEGYVCSACLYLPSGEIRALLKPDEQKNKDNWMKTELFRSEYDCKQHCWANHGAAGNATPQKVILFYRSSGDYGYLSNLYKRDVRFENRTFRSSEDAYQFGKPLDGMVAEWIIAAPKPHLCAMAAHGLLAFDIRPDWQAIKVDRMRDVLRAKFSQHEDLKQNLIDTGNAVLIEDSNTDAFWGIGKKRNGKNMLGILLMQVREELNNATPKTN